jgi:hypothetical protein
VAVIQSRFGLWPEHLDDRLVLCLQSPAQALPLLDSHWAHWKLFVLVTPWCTWLIAHAGVRWRTDKLESTAQPILDLKET